MQISTVVPAFGLILLVFNIVLAAVRPLAHPTIMGIQLYIAGMITLLIAVIDLINPIGITATERAVLFISGCLNCFIGYYMVLLEIRKRGV
jgi:hypothetical protein